MASRANHKMQSYDRKKFKMLIHYALYTGVMSMPVVVAMAAASMGIAGMDVGEDKPHLPHHRCGLLHLHALLHCCHHHCWHQRMHEIPKRGDIDVAVIIVVIIP